MSPSLFLSKHASSILSPVKLASRRRQWGRGYGAALAVLALAAGAGAGGVWWMKRPAEGASGAGNAPFSGAAPAGSTGSTATIASLNTASGAVLGAATAPASAASAAGGGARGTGGAGRFGGAGRPQPVTVEAVRQQDMRVIVNAVGNLASLNTAVVRSRVDGELRKISFKEGQQVKAGQALAEIDPRSYEVALASAQAQLARDQAQLKNAQLDWERYKDLLAKDSIAKQQVDTQEALVRQLEATLKADQASVDNAKLQLSYTKIAAPIAGRLGLRQVDPGNMVRSGDANGIVVINQTQPIGAIFAVPEANLARISARLKAGQEMTVEALDREGRQRLASGRVIAVDNAVDVATGTIKIKASFANKEDALFPNQFVNIRMQVDAVEQALAVPSNAIQRGAIGIFVYAVNAENTVSMRRVRPGVADGDWVAVQGDLQAGDRVVTDGADRLRDGGKVEVITPQRGGFGAGGMGAGGAARAGQASGAATGAAPGAPAANVSKPGDAAEQRPRQRVNAAGESAPGASGAANGSSEARAPAGQGGQAGSGRSGASAAPPASPAPTGAPSAGGQRPDAWIDSMPPQAQERIRAALERLGPEQAAKVHKMSPDERREFFRQMRERREQSQGQ